MTSCQFSLISRTLSSVPSSFVDCSFYNFSFLTHIHLAYSLMHLLCFLFHVHHFYCVQEITCHTHYNCSLHTFPLLQIHTYHTQPQQHIFISFSQLLIIVHSSPHIPAHLVHHALHFSSSLLHLIII